VHRKIKHCELHTARLSLHGQVCITVHKFTSRRKKNKFLPFLTRSAVIHKNVDPTRPAGRPDVWTSEEAYMHHVSTSDTGLHLENKQVPCRHKTQETAYSVLKKRYVVCTWRPWRQRLGIRTYRLTFLGVFTPKRSLLRTQIALSGVRERPCLWHAMCYDAVCSWYGLLQRRPINWCCSVALLVTHSHFTR